MLGLVSHIPHIVAHASLTDHPTMVGSLLADEAASPGTFWPEAVALAVYRAHALEARREAREARTVPSILAWRREAEQWEAHARALVANLASAPTVRP